MKTTWTRRAANGYQTERISYQTSSRNGRCDVLIWRTDGAGGPFDKGRISFDSETARLDWKSTLCEALIREGWTRLRTSKKQHGN